MGILNFFKDWTCTWSKDDWLPPKYDRPGSPLKFFNNSTCTWSKDDWPSQVWQTRISPRIFLMIQHAHGQKMIDPPKYDRPGSHLEYFFKDSTCTWSKDDWPLQVWQTRISPRIFFKDSTCPWSKDDWPSQVWQTRISPRIFLMIQHAHGHSDNYLSHSDLFCTLHSSS